MDKSQNSAHLTEGQYRVGIDFNPGGNEAVNDIKRKAAELIDLVNNFAAVTNVTEARRCAALAATHFEDGAMWAVKAVTKPPRQ